MPQLKTMIGEQIMLRSPVLSDDFFTTAKLVEVDEAGIWIEYPPFLERMLNFAKASQSPKTILIFLPYAQVSFVLSSENYPYLSEKLIE